MSLSSVMEHLNMQLPACIQTGARTKFAFAADELIWSPLPPSDQGRALIHSFIRLFTYLYTTNWPSKFLALWGCILVTATAAGQFRSLRSEATYPRAHDQQVARPKQMLRLPGAAGQGNGTE